MPCGVIIVDEHLNIIECNKNLANMLGEEVRNIFEAKPGLNGADLRKLLPFHKLFQSETDMTTKNDPYASEEDTRALLNRNKRTDAEKRLEAMLEDRFANEQGVELEGRFNILRQIALELLEPKSYRFPAESAKFKAWYDAWWLGDGFQAESIPGYEDPDFPKYLNGYTLAFGAWMAAKHDSNMKG